MLSHNRLITLDGMRGVAALMVVLFHHHRELAPSGYFAVDFFFALSGFVVARTYDARLLTGLSAWEFKRIRIMRLYPLYLAGLLIGVIRYVALIVDSNPGRLPIFDAGVGLFFGAFFLPSPLTEPLGPFNLPSWSLYFELFINIIYAVVLVRCNRLVLLVLLGLSGVALAYAGYGWGSLDVGVNWVTLMGAVARVTFGFTVGILISRSHKFEIRESFISLVPAFLLVAVMFVQAAGHMRLVVDLVLVVLISPVLLWIGASYNPPALLTRVAEFLGLVSYPMYAIHYPLLIICGDFFRKSHISGVFWLIPFFVFLIFFAWMLGKYFDPFVRRNIKQRRTVGLGVIGAQTVIP